MMHIKEIQLPFSPEKTLLLSLLQNPYLQEFKMQ